ncbi:MAG: amidohydrolase family protein, partial [Steroidobacteraceae bacterium]
MALLADSSPSSRSAHRGALLHFLGDPGTSGARDSFEYWPDGLLIVDRGLVVAVGPAVELLATLGCDTPIVEHGDSLILPGFIDTHIHYPQTDIIGSGGAHLLDWLEKYTFPAERRFGDPAHAREVANFFLDELLANGTTTA